MNIARSATASLQAAALLSLHVRARQVVMWQPAHALHVALLAAMQLQHQTFHWVYNLGHALYIGHGLGGLIALVAPAVITCGQ